MTKLTATQQNDKIALVRKSTSITHVTDAIAKHAVSMRKFAYIVTQYCADDIIGSYYVSVHSSHRAAREALFKHAKTAHGSYTAHAYNKRLDVLLRCASAVDSTIDTAQNNIVLTVKMVHLMQNEFIY